MNHFYENIQGWFDFQDIYSEQVKRAKDGFHFVEIGSWLGRSTAYMIAEIVSSGKQIKFDVVDTWKGTPGEECYKETLEKYNGDIYEAFIKNMGEAIKYIQPMRMSSVDAASKYSNESLDFIFIDACHLYECVKSDLQVWYPKLKKNGCIAGHDYPLHGVKSAVDEFFGAYKVKTLGISWVYDN